MAGLSKPREAALKALVSVEKDGAYLNIVLRDILSSSDMDDRDKALSQAIAFGTVKNSVYLDNIIKNLSKVKLNKLSVWIHNILRMGIFCIKFMDRIPQSATVNECVKLSRRYGHASSAGYVNALLRNACKCGDFLPKDPSSAEYISIKYSFPAWLTEKWLAEGYTEELFRSMNEEPPVTVRLNTLKATSLPNEFAKADFSPFSYVYNGSGGVENTDCFKSGHITVQDGASQKAVMSLDVKKDMSVLDLCSAPGGKTGFIAQLLENTGEIISCDIHPHKLELIDANMSRLGVTNTKTMLNDATVFCKEFENRFDRVLCDVPCSGLGVLRRKPDIKWTKSDSDNSDLVKIQRKIIDCAVQYVKKGGILVYSTCTINREENEENVKYLLENYNDFSLTDTFKDTFGRQLLPYKDGTDGFFYATFERK